MPILWQVEQAHIYSLILMPSVEALAFPPHSFSTEGLETRLAHICLTVMTYEPFYINFMHACLASQTVTYIYNGNISGHDVPLDSLLHSQ